ncbi:MAG: TIM barrel protein [Planctomycetes bacterium]|nr:TIM barrel protein [Planctomycetota bacterium]
MLRTVAVCLATVCLVALPISIQSPVTIADETGAVEKLFARKNLVAWCIVPFDDRKRSPQERAEMLGRLGFRRFAYDYRAEHIPTFDAEIEALKAHNIELTAWWFPPVLNDEARQILSVLERHGVKTQLWVTGAGGPTKSADEQRSCVQTEAARIRPIAEAAARIGCSVGLYNHGGWFGEPENQLEILRELNLPNVGMVYNLHHGHEHVDRFAELLNKVRPHLYALNLNGMVRGGEGKGLKIVPLGEGELDLALLKIIVQSGYSGPIGILNHTQENAEARLQDNLDGLDWLVRQLDGSPPGPKPELRTWKRAAVQRSQAASPLGAHHGTEGTHGTDGTDVPAGGALPFDDQLAARLADESHSQGNALRGAEVFTSTRFACINCHKVAELGGTVGPELTSVAAKQTDEHLVESVLWPKRKVAAEHVVHAVLTTDGRALQGVIVAETSEAVALRIPTTGETVVLQRSEIDEAQTIGTLMPDGMAAAMTRQQQLDLFRFLIELRSADPAVLDAVGRFIKLAHVLGPQPVPFDRAPLDPDRWPHWQHRINRDRIYDFYAKEADHFRRQTPVPPLLPQFPGLDGGTLGHWGNQTEQDWVDDRWNDTVLGPVQCGVFHGKGVTVPRGVCVRLGDRGELAACFDPDTLTYAAVWRVEGDRYVRFSDVRHGFLGGLTPNGRLQPITDGSAPTTLDKQSKYLGFYQHDGRIIFAYRIGETTYLDAPWASDDGHLQRVVAPADQHPLKHAVQGGQRQWEWEFEAAGELGRHGPFAVDTIPLPFDNPWKAMLFCGGHDFLPDGSALVCTMQGDVWHVTGLGAALQHVGWRRFAAGLHHALGLVIDSDGIFVLGRNQITRLHDLNQDGEADFYECFSRAFATSSAGHDFICGLERDAEGRFYTASGNQGLVRISADGQQAEVLATGFRNPDGVCLSPDGTATVPCSEGDWTPASMICAVPLSGAATVDSSAVPFFGYGGPRNGNPPELPLIYLPRALDNSSGSQVAITGAAWKPLAGNMVHLSYGAGTGYLLLTDEVRGQRQGAVVPLDTEFRSGAHRGRFHPIDGQLYVTGMGGWGTYTPDDGCFHRVRFMPGDGEPGGVRTEVANLPRAFHVHENGILLTFISPLKQESVEQAENHFAQCWNYRYSSGYGSPELSPSHPGTPGHDPLTIASAHLVGDRSLFLEIPDLQPVNQLHLSIGLDRDDSSLPRSARRCELFLTVHALDAAFTGFPGYQPRAKTIAAHPLLADLALALKTVPNPWQKRNKQARPITLETAGNLSFATRSFQVRAGELIALTLKNPDVVPHNWALVRPGTLQSVGEAANRLIADPEAVARQYVPDTGEVLFYTDIVPPGGEFTIYFQAPQTPGRYPYLCTFPGHWTVMNGEMLVTGQ